MSNFYNDKVVVLTGAGGGLGKELVTQLLQLGAKIIAIDLDVKSLAPQANLAIYALDITDRDALEESIKQGVMRLGPVDILINNAGITHMSRFQDLSAELFDKIMAVNLNAAVELTRICLADLVKQKGHIVTLSSVAGFAPLYGRSAYSASKHAMEGFFLSLASELKPQGVGSTIVRPSFIKTRPELKAQVNGGVSSPGAMKKSTNGEQIEPYYAAQQILKAVQHDKLFLPIGRVSRIAALLYKVMPSLYLKVMTKGAEKEFR